MKNFTTYQPIAGITLPFFPTPLSDDSLYGWICRYHQVSGNAHPRETRKQLIGAHHHWPDEYLARELMIGMSAATGLDVDYLIDHYTQLPLCSWLKHGYPYDDQDCLMSSDIVQELFPYWELPKRPKVTLWRDRPKVCMACYEKDFETIGYAYWHLYHQPQFVTVCAEHRTRLLFGCPQCGTTFSNKAFNLPTPKCRRCDDLTITAGYVSHFRVAQIEILMAQITRHFINLRCRPRLGWNCADGCRRVANHVGIDAGDLLDKWSEPSRYASATEVDLNETKQAWGVWATELSDYYPPARSFDGFRVPRMMIDPSFVAHVLQDEYGRLSFASDVLWLLAYAVTRGVGMDEVVRIYMGDDPLP